MFRFCEIDPIEFWKYTPAETEIMITAAMKREEVKVYRQAQLLALICNVHGVTKRNSDHGYDIEDFLPESMIPKPKKRTVDQIWAEVMAANQALGGQVVDINQNQPNP